MTLPVNKPLANPSDIDAYNALIKKIFLSFKCHDIVQVQKFDPGGPSIAPTIQAQIMYTKTFIVKTASGYVTKEKDYPILVSIPVFIPSGGAVTMTFPISVGDYALIAYNDRDISNWFSSGQKMPLATPRLHSITDGIAFVGLFPNSKGFTAYDIFRSVWTDGVATVAVGPKTLVDPSLVKIGNISTTLGVQLQSLITQLQTLIAQIAIINVGGVSAGAGTSGPPTNAPAILAISATLTATATQLSTILE